MQIQLLDFILYYSLFFFFFLCSKNWHFFIQLTDPCVERRKKRKLARETGMAGIYNGRRHTCVHSLLFARNIYYNNHYMDIRHFARSPFLFVVIQSIDSPLKKKSPTTAEPRVLLYFLFLYALEKITGFDNE